MLCTGQSLCAPGSLLAGVWLHRHANPCHPSMAREDEDEPEARAAENQKILFYSCATRLNHVNSPLVMYLAVAAG
jgi:hypothetical protein